MFMGHLVFGAGCLACPKREGNRRSLRKLRKLEWKKERKKRRKGEGGGERGKVSFSVVDFEILGSVGFRVSCAREYFVLPAKK